MKLHEMSADDLKPLMFADSLENLLHLRAAQLKQTPEVLLGGLSFVAKATMSGLALDMENKVKSLAELARVLELYDPVYPKERIGLKILCDAAHCDERLVVAVADMMDEQARAVMPDTKVSDILHLAHEQMLPEHKTALMECTLFRDFIMTRAEQLGRSMNDLSVQMGHHESYFGGTIRKGEKLGVVFSNKHSPAEDRLPEMIRVLKISDADVIGKLCELANRPDLTGKVTARAMKPTQAAAVC